MLRDEMVGRMVHDIALYTGIFIVLFDHATGGCRVMCFCLGLSKL